MAAAVTAVAEATQAKATAARGAAGPKAKTTSAADDGGSQAPTTTGLDEEDDEDLDPSDYSFDGDKEAGDSGRHRRLLAVL